MSEYELYHIDDMGRKVDLSDKQKELADEAKDRSAEKIAEKVEEDPEMTEDKYMAELYPKDHDEYLVNGAVLECDMAKGEIKQYRGKTYNVPSPDTTTVLNVTENPQAKCGYLYHATVKDRKAGVNIPPFRCNCDGEPHNDKEWAKLEKDESCLMEGTCKALINLCDEWDNIPTEKSYMMFWNEDMQGMVPGITMSSMLFCRHGGIIKAKSSGQTLHEILVGISSVAYTNGDKWKAEQIDMAKYVSEKMFLEGYSLEIIAGFIGNFVNEGNFGYFESSKYVKNPEPDYLIHMDSHGYRTDISGENVFDVGTKMLKKYRKNGNCSDEYHKFGFGMAQWTEERCEKLIDKYLDKFGDNACPTRKECAEIEVNYLLEELSDSKSDVIKRCEDETAEMSGDKKVKKMAEIIMTDYEVAGKENTKMRQEAACIWYEILTGENNEK